MNAPSRSAPPPNTAPPRSAPPPSNGSGSRPSAPPPPNASATAAVDPATAAQFAIIRGRERRAQRVMLYGPGGVGKSTLASLAPRPLVLDIEGSTSELEVARIKTINSFPALRANLQAYDRLAEFDTIVLDTVTKAEEFAVAHTFDTVPNENGQRVDRLEGYGWGKGPRHVYDTFMLMLQDLDQLVERGKHVIVIAHSQVTTTVNPSGTDWWRHEPRLLSSKNADIRERIYNWADHVLFVGFDVVVNKEGLGTGGGARTIHTRELPSHRAKTRRKVDPRPFANEADGSIWDLILGAQQQ